MLGQDHMKIVGGWKGITLFLSNIVGDPGSWFTSHVISWGETLVITKLIYPSYKQLDTPCGDMVEHSRDEKTKLTFPLRVT